MDSSSSEHRTDTPSLDYSMPLFLSRSRDDGENSETMKKLEKRTIIVLTEGGKEGGRGLIGGSFIVTYLPLCFLPLRCHSRVRCCSQFSHTSFLPPSSLERSSRCRYGRGRRRDTAHNAINIRLEILPGSGSCIGDLFESPAVPDNFLTVQKPACNPNKTLV